MDLKGWEIRLLNSIFESKLNTLRAFIRAGYTVHNIMLDFNLTQAEAETVFKKYAIYIKGYEPLILGYKDEAYFTEKESLELPKYNILDLEGEEKVIASKNTSTKLFEMGRMKDLYMEIQDHYDGNIPEDLTIGEYLHKKKLEEEEWELHEQQKTLEKENPSDDEVLDNNP